MHIVDRRLNPGSKSLENRQRFLRRAKALVQDAIAESKATSKAQLGQVMKIATEKAAGRVDGKTLSQTVRDALP